MIRSILFWGIPAALAATLIWTFLPREHLASRAGPPRPPVASGPPQAPADPSPQASRPSSSEPSSGTASSAAPRPRAAPFAEVRQGDLEGTDDTGRRQWRIVADAVTVVHNKDAVLLRNVRATFYERDGGTIEVTGAQGRFDAKTREVAIEGDVHGKSSNGRELFADRLHWVPKPGKLTGSGHIRLVQEHVVMYADEMTSDTTLGRTEFFGHVHASVR